MAATEYHRRERGGRCGGPVAGPSVPLCDGCVLSLAWKKIADERVVVCERNGEFWRSFSTVYDRNDSAAVRDLGIASSLSRSVWGHGRVLGRIDRRGEEEEGLIAFEGTTHCRT